MRRRALFGKKEYKSNVSAGDMLLINMTTMELLFVKPSDFSVAMYPQGYYYGVGVCVIPDGHKLYTNGECAVISLETMSCTTIGDNTNEYMMWGSASSDISVSYYSKLISLGSMTGEVQSNLQETFSIGKYSSKRGYLPSNKGLTGKQCPHDTDTNYISSNVSNYYFMPSTYNEDDSRNMMYSQTSSPSSRDNALSHFGGQNDTYYICKKRGSKDYNSWLPNSETEGDFPAASCCDMYHIYGTNQGDWYLPSIGELGYIMPKYKEINNSINKLVSSYGFGVGFDDYNFTLWSSTLNSYGCAYVIDYSSGGVTCADTTGFKGVRAFMRLTPQ